MNTPRIFSLILFLSLVGLALFWLVSFVEQRIVFWRRRAEAGGLNA